MTVHSMHGVFFKAKSELKAVMLALFKDLKVMHGITMRTHVCCDNTGENKAFKILWKQKWMGGKFEYNMPGTSQQNGCI